MGESEGRESIEESATIDGAAETLNLFLFDGEFVIVGDLLVYINGHLRYHLNGRYCFIKHDEAKRYG